MNETAQYQEKCRQAEAAITQDYYNGQPAFKGPPACIPTVPLDADGDPLIALEDVPFQYIELHMPDGANRLAVLTPFAVANGPGQRYRVIPAR